MKEEKAEMHNINVQQTLRVHVHVQWILQCIQVQVQRTLATSKRTVNITSTWNVGPGPPKQAAKSRYVTSSVYT